MSELQTFLQAGAALALRFLVEPYAAFLVGGFAGGYAIGTSKNRTALSEIVRGIIAAVVFGALVWLAQRLILNGGAA